VTSAVLVTGLIFTLSLPPTLPFWMAIVGIGVGVGVIVGIIDAAKRALAILMVYAAGISQLAILLAGIAAVIGHNWPVFLGFRSGRGECTTIGVFSVLITLPMLIAGGLTIATLLKTRNVIKTSIALFVSLPLL